MSDDAARLSAVETARSALIRASRQSDIYALTLDFESAVRAERAVPAPQLDALRAENARLRELINIDRTGLAAGLAEVQRIVHGWDWMADPDGGNGSYTYDEWTETARRREVRDLITRADEAATKALRESGRRADAAYQQIVGEAVPAPAAPSPIGSVAEARRRLKAIMYPSSQDVGQAEAAIDALIEAVCNEKSAAGLNGQAS